ncbi:MAG: hypothetical protein GY875_22080 [Gammaproteobacteria bacterium]|nr:hypothetical protein [Gammaproteobacteria bacterium]
MDNNEQKPGYAYLPGRWDDVKHALEDFENFSMESYARVSPANKGSFILSEDDPAIHDPRHDALTAALQDPFLSEKMDASVEESWQQFAGYRPLSDRFDIRIFARTVALRFTGKFFGIDEKYIFRGDENLEKWSEIAYENFMWKLHGRHFGDQNPEMDAALLKIATIVQISMRKPAMHNAVTTPSPIDATNSPESYSLCGNPAGLTHVCNRQLGK